MNSYVGMTRIKITEHLCSLGMRSHAVLLTRRLFFLTIAIPT